MALRERLQQLSNGLEDIPGTELRDEWVEAVRRLGDMVGSDLKEYVAEGLISISGAYKQISELRLGIYLAEERTFRSGNSSLILSPVYRMYQNSFGRVDLFNAARPGYGYLFLRQSQTQDRSAWRIARRAYPLNVNHLLGISSGGPLDSGRIEEINDYTKERLETLIEILV